MTKFGEIAIFFSLLEWNTLCCQPASWRLRVDLAPSNLLDSVFRVTNTNSARQEEAIQNYKTNFATWTLNSVLKQ